MNIVVSVLLYRAPTWSMAVRVPDGWKEMEKVHQRAALRCVSAYHIVSTEAVCMLACIPPLELLVEE